MKIAVDARILSEPITGIGRYTYEVLRRAIEFGHDWYLYSHRPLLIGNWDHPNVFVKSFNLSGRIPRMLWAQTYLPYLAIKDNVDLFWSPAHRIPQFLPASIASVVTIHDLVWCHAGNTMRTTSKWLDSLLMPSAINISKSVISVSSATTRDLLNKFPDAAQKIITIPLGVDASHSVLSTRNVQVIPFQDPYILFVGTLEPRKNLKNLIEAFSIASKSIEQSIRLVIVGGVGWGGIDPQQIANQYGIGCRVDVMGYVSEDQLQTLYRNSMFLAIPSLYEGFGLPIIEAMSYGVPVLTSNISSMPEVAGEAAIYVDPRDINSIAKGLIKLSSNKDLRVQLAYKSIENSRKYSWERSAKETVKVFENLHQEKFDN